MKIALVLERFDPARGGLEHWTWQFADQLCRLGHDVHVVACEFANPAPNPAVILHVVQPCRWPLERAAAFEPVLRSLACDVIHDMGVGWYADIFHLHGGSSRASHEHNLLRIPRWRQIRLWRERRYREQAEVEARQLRHKDSFIVAVSHMVKTHFQTLHNVPQEKLRVITNGVDTERFSPELCRDLREATRRDVGCDDAESLFLLAAHNLRLKNADSAIRAVAQLHGEGYPVRLVIVGGKKPEPFLRLAATLGLSDRVSFVAPVADVRPYYGAADILLHPTWYDPCSLVVLEALACGLPVITTRFNGASEFMTEGQEGFTLPDPANVSALAAKMREALVPQRRAAMGESARRLALRQSFARQTEGFLNLYREIIADRTNRIS